MPQRTPLQRRSRRPAGAAPLEYLQWVGAVALAGAASFGTLGGRMGDAVAGEVAGRSTSAAATVTTSSQAGAASALSDMERILKTYDEAPVGLYKNLERKLPASRYDATLSAYEALKWQERLNGDAALPNYEAFRTLADVMDDPAVRTAYDLFAELWRLELGRWVDSEESVVVGTAPLGVVARQTDAHEWLAQAIDAAVSGRRENTTAYLAKAREELRLIRWPAPTAFLERIVAVAAIHNDAARTITQARFDRLFRGAGRADDAAPVVPVAKPATITESLFDRVGRMDGVSVDPVLFALGYLADPAAALGRLAEPARAYLEAEVLPMLRQLRTGKNGKTAPVLSADGEARVLAAIARGDVESAKAALKKAVGGGAPPGELVDGVHYAAQVFARAEVPAPVALRPFTTDELLSLVRLRDDAALAALEARADGGAEVAELVRAANALALDRRPARPESHGVTILEDWLRTVARGDADSAAEYAAHAADIFREVPALLRDAMGQVLEAFGRGAKGE